MSQKGKQRGNPETWNGKDVLSNLDDGQESPLPESSPPSNLGQNNHKPVGNLLNTGSFSHSVWSSDYQSIEPPFGGLGMPRRIQSPNSNSWTDFSYEHSANDFEDCGNTNYDNSANNYDYFEPTSDLKEDLHLYNMYPPSFHHLGSGATASFGNSTLQLDQCLTNTKNTFDDLPPALFTNRSGPAAMSDYYAQVTDLSNNLNNLSLRSAQTSSNAYPPQRSTFEALDNRPTPSSLGWPPNSDNAKLYKLIVRSKENIWLELKNEADLSANTPWKVFLDKPGSTSTKEYVHARSFVFSIFPY
ncbi:MAG: hypothetical protein CL912_00955 [Deltaproteobacteria bacterium]|nr:hypothetical protein [Deltaproteobacteria bacterium]